MEFDPISAPRAARGMLGIAQPVAAPLTRAAIFLVATLNAGLENRMTVRSFCGDLAALLRAVESRDLEGAFHASSGLGLTHGISSLDHRGRRISIRSGRFVPRHAMRSRLRATCCSTYARSAWIYASSLRRKS